MDHDDSLNRARIDHIGWRLWNATAQWKRAFAQGMVDAGHGWYAEARGSILPYIDPRGTKQTVLTQRIGLTKQAVQQMVDDLEREGVVARRPDPDDGRAKIIVFTEKGVQAQQDAEQIKRRVEADIRARIGDADFARLYEILRRLAPD